MKLVIFLSIITTVAAVGPFVPFPYEPFGVYKERRVHELEEAKKVVPTSNKKDAVEAKKDVVDEFEEAQKALFHAFEDAEKRVLKAANKAEHAVEHALHDEVDNIFHGLPKHTKVEEVDKKVKRAKKIVETGEKTVKKVEKCWPENLKESLEECLAGDIE